MTHEQSHQERQQIYRRRHDEGQTCRYQRRSGPGRDPAVNQKAAIKGRIRYVLGNILKVSDALFQDISGPYYNSR